jgi:diacylglycerol O-acyltransferase
VTAAGERMSGADAAWLHMDRPTNRMVIHCVVWFDRPVDWAAAANRVHDRLVLRYPRFRQRVREPSVPLGPVAAPQWLTDRDFRMEHHLRYATLPAPGDTPALHRYVAAQMPRALDLARPLWELHFIDGYGNGSALLVRLHHAVADGIALMQLLRSLGDDYVEPAPAPAAGVADEVRRAVGGAIHWMAGTGLLDLVEFAGATAASLAKLGLPRQDRRTVLRGTLGVEKRVAWCEPVPLDAVKTFASEVGSTVNDVLLAVIAGALRRYLIAHDSLVDEIGAVVPFNVRPLDRPVPLELGNKFGLVFPTLPVGLADLRARIAAVKRAMDEIKLSRQGWLTFGWLTTVGRTPTEMENALIDLYAGMGSVIITNIVGPPTPVALVGTPAAGMLAWVPTSGPIGLGVSIVSYAGALTVGLVVDARLVSDDDRLLAALEVELRVFGGRRPGAPGRPRSVG